MKRSENGMTTKLSVLAFMDDASSKLFAEATKNAESHKPKQVKPVQAATSDK